jgi:cobalt/nickel transport protein
MRRAIPLVLTVACLVQTSSLWAHYHILLPQTASAPRGTPVSFVLQFGHPFEHQFFETSKPESLIVVLPDGKSVDLAATLKKDTIKNSEQKDVAVYRFQYVPEQRGDFIFVVKAAPVWMEEEQLFLRDTVRVTLHVLTQKGWHHSRAKGFDMVPLTRPYGLEPGIVFQAQAILDGKPLASALVEIERMNVAPPKKLPADEQITRSVKTDPNGVATCTMLGPGWWCVTGQRRAGKREHQGKMFPVRERSTLWVFVDESH